MPRLDDTAVEEGLQHLPGWERRGSEIVKTFTREDFAHAMVFVNEVVEHQRVAVPAPPVPHHLVRQDDEVLGLLTPVDDDPPELVMVDARHPPLPRVRSPRGPVPIG